MASIATPDNGDSNLSKEPGNEVCDIINCVATKGASENSFWVQVSRKLRKLRSLKALKGFERNCQVCLLFKTYFGVDFLDLVILLLLYTCIHGVYMVNPVWSGVTFMLSALCYDCWSSTCEVFSLTEVKSCDSPAWLLLCANFYSSCVYKGDRFKGTSILDVGGVWW